jgi:hypothetical protein
MLWTEAPYAYMRRTLVLRILAMAGTGATVWWASAFTCSAWGDVAPGQSATLIAGLSTVVSGPLLMQKFPDLLVVPEQTPWSLLLRRLAASAALSYVALAVSLLAEGRAFVALSGRSFDTHDEFATGILALWFPLWVLPLTSALITWQWMRSDRAGMRSRRPLWTPAVLLVAVVVTFAAAEARRRIAEHGQRRESGYQKTLRSYIGTFPLGTPRSDVETRLRTEGQAFHHSCCIRQPPRGGEGAWDVMIPIGVESAPWYCSEHTIYIGVEFAPDTPRTDLEARDADTVSSVTLLRQMGGCL